MHGKSLVMVGITILVVVGALAFLRLGRSNVLTPTPSASSTDSKPFCTPGDLQAQIELGSAAGNVYGTVTLKNISPTECEVLGGGFITANYDSSVKNIIVTHIGQTQEQPFILSPGQTMYSQVHFPNGPQCQSIGLKPTNTTFSYQISANDTVSFKNQAGSTVQVVQTCQSLSDITEIQIWSMANQPITP